MDMDPKNTVIVRIDAPCHDTLDALLGMHCGFSSRTIDAFQHTSADDGTDGSELITSILSDLMRISERNGVDFDQCLREARAHRNARRAND